MNETITIAYCVGGKDKYYKSLQKSLQSIRDNIHHPIKIKVFDSDNKLESNDEYEVIHLPVEKDNIHGHQFQRYKIAEYIDTDWCIYADTDIVFYQDRIEHFLKDAQDFTITQHFWVPHAKKYLKCHPIPQKTGEYIFENNINCNYYASGIFAFKPEEHKEILDKVRKKFIEVHLNDMSHNEYITDECILASVLKDYPVNIVNGSWNHCAIPNEMPLKYVEEDQILYGCNPFDNKEEPVFCFHADTFSRKPHEKYKDENIKKDLQKAFYL